MPETESWDEVEAALDELLALPEDARLEALDRLTGNRHALRATLQSLLMHASGADDLLSMTTFLDGDSAHGGQVS